MARLGGCRSGIPLWTHSPRQTLHSSLQLASYRGWHSGCGAVSVAVLVANLVVIQRWADRTWPQDRLAKTLLEALVHLEKMDKSSRTWLLSNQRNQVVASLEKAARLLENGLVRTLHCGDRTTQIWASNSFSRAAAGMRARKKWLLTPRADTRTVLIGVIAADLAKILDGDWDGLERAEPDIMGRTRLCRVHISRIPRVIITAAIPLVAVSILQNSPMAVSKPVSDYLDIGAVALATITLLTAIDPEYSGKLKGVRDMVNLVRPQVKP